jgi:hypothetical protein
MNGVITSADVLRNIVLIGREFGLGCLFRCFRAFLQNKPTTFLQVAMARSNRPPRTQSLVGSAREIATRV